MFRKIIDKALHSFFASESGEKLIGNIMLKAVSISLDRTVQIEDGKSEPGKTVIKTETVNILDHLAKYMPYVEAAIRGVQVDAGQARNRSVEVLNEMGGLKQIFADEIDRRNTIDSEMLGKGILLATSKIVQQLSVDDIKRIANNTELIEQSKEN